MRKILLVLAFVTLVAGLGVVAEATACDPGQYCSNWFIICIDCSSCPAGFWCDGDDMYFCPAGTYTPSLGFSYCIDCPAGTFQPSPGSSFCYDGPIAANDTYTTDRVTPLSVDSPGVLGNDVVGGIWPLTALLLTDVDNGTLTLNSNGSFYYSPGPHFVGTSFTYEAYNSWIHSEPATVTIVAEAQGGGKGCNEPPCVRILDPVDGSTVNWETSFLVEVTLMDEFTFPGEICEVHVDVTMGETPDTYYYLFLQQNQRPQGGSPVYYVVDYSEVSPLPPDGVMTLSSPVADEGDSLPQRFRILGELHLEPDDNLRFIVSASCSISGSDTRDIFFSTTSP